MTDNDNKDPQITAEELINQKITTQELLDNLHLIQAYSDAKTSDELVKKYQFLGRFLHSNGDIVIELLLQLSAELKQLRAERAGFTDTLDSLELALFDVAGALEQTKLDFIHQQIIETLGEIRQAKSKLTDSAQRGEG